MEDNPLETWAEAMHGLTSEGTISEIQAQYLHDFVIEHNILHVCETGLGLGRSAWAFLDAGCIVNTFDNNGYPPFSEQVANRLYNRFPGRHRTWWGDSTFSIPYLKEINSMPMYRLAYIDGGHDLDTAYADIINLYQLNTFVIFDDLVEDKWAEGCKFAWEQAVKRGYVLELDRQSDGPTHIWGIGRYV